MGLEAIAFLLGAAGAAYVTRHSGVLGSPFPSLDHRIAVRPTLARLTLFFSGRLFGLTLVGAGIHVVGSLQLSRWVDRAAYAGLVLLAVFMMLFLATGHAPEMALARRSDPSRGTLPLFWRGTASSVTLIAPFLALLIFFLEASSWQDAGSLLGGYFFGGMIMLIPVLRNWRVARGHGLHLIQWWIIFVAAFGLMFFGMHRFVHQ